MSPQFKKLVALDFDGVIHQYTSGWKGELVIPDPPMPGSFAFIMMLIDNDYEVAIVSSRLISLEAQQVMSDWFLYHGLPLVYLEQLQWPDRKPPAFMTIDDRAMRFEGSWPSLEDLSQFRPWKIGTTSQTKNSASPESSPSK